MTVTPQAAFALTLEALHDYAEERTKYIPGMPRALLKLEWQNGVAILQKVNEEDMTFLDRVKHFFGLGGYRLKTIVDYLQSDTFCKLMRDTPITTSEQDDIHAAALSLDLKIKKYNDAHWFFKIKTQEKSLSKSIGKWLIKSEEAMEVHQVAKERLLSVHSVQSFPKNGDNSPRSAVQAALSTYESTLNQAVKRGDIVLNSRGEIVGSAAVLKKRSELIELLQKTTLDQKILQKFWQKLSQIHNRAYVGQEIRKLHFLVSQGSISIAQSIQRVLARAKGAVPVPRKVIIEQQLAALHRLLDKDASYHTLRDMDFAKMELLISNIKGEAFFKTCGLTAKRRIEWQAAFHEICKAKQRIDIAQGRMLEIVEDDLKSQGVPELSRKSLLQGARSYARALFQTAWGKLVEGPMSEFAKGKITLAKFTKKLVTECTEIEAARVLLEKLKTGNWGEQHQFYLNWQHALRSEMVQGLVDSGETLGKGVCWALSLRWTIDEMKHKQLSAVQEVIDQLEIGKTRSQDRRLQALYHIGRSGQKDLIEKSLGIKKEVSETFEEPGNVSKVLATIINDRTFQSTYQGIAQLSFWWEGGGHAISIHCQKDSKNPVFRFHEPNFGTFEFSTQEEFIECLSELIATTYSKEIDSLEYRCFKFIKGGV